MSLPPALYHDPDIHALELDRLFGRDWTCMGRLAEIPRPGDYLSRDIAGTPVAVVRQRDDSLRALSNVCLHRSARLLEGDGHVARISCPYHSWTYGLDGRLVGAPHMAERGGFEARSMRLPELRVATWQGFVYVAPGGDTPPPAERLAALTERIDDYRMADYVPVFSARDTWHSNWKCLVENFMDAYHVHRVHRDSFARFGSSEDRTVLLDGDDAFTGHYVDEDSGPKSVSAHADNTWVRPENRHRTWLLNLFPGHTLQLQPDMLWYLSILPLGIDRVGIRWAVSLPAEILGAAPDRQAAIDPVMALIHKVNSEDRPVVENVFRATRSVLARQGPLSHLERNVWQFGRYLARRLAA